MVQEQTPSDPPLTLNAALKRRFVLGIGLFTLGWIITLNLVPIINATSLPPATKATLSSFLIVALPKFFLVGAIAIMGRPGFDYLKSAIGMKIRPVQTVSPLRHRIGLTLFVMALLVSNIMAYTGQILPRPPWSSSQVALVCDLILLASLFILGGNFWDKIRALFVREAIVAFPEPTK
jgi:hypothetical protein